MGADVSAVITVYNGEAVLRRSIESVLRQTVPVAELIVVDDGSTDGTPDVARSYGDRVTYLRQDNRGVAAARNAGLSRAAAPWVAFLDDDDEWLPEKIERQHAALHRDPQAAASYTALWFHQLDGTAVREHLPRSDLPRVMRLRNPFPPSVMMARRDALLELGGFDERLRGASCEDWDLNVRLLSRFRVLDVDEPLTNYYENGSSNSLRHYRRMLTNSLSILDATLLSGLSGLDRAVWRRRIQGRIYQKAAISARQLGEPAVGLLLKSIALWPAPDGRLKTLALELGRALRAR
jgi:glycosyltransferase involved in cell wall biosynthesis